MQLDDRHSIDGCVCEVKAELKYGSCGGFLNIPALSKMYDSITIETKRFSLTYHECSEFCAGRPTTIRTVPPNTWEISNQGMTPPGGQNLFVGRKILGNGAVRARTGQCVGLTDEKVFSSFHTPNETMANPAPGTFLQIQIITIESRWVRAEIDVKAKVISVPAISVTTNFESLVVKESLRLSGSFGSAVFDLKDAKLCRKMKKVNE